MWLTFCHISNLTLSTWFAFMLSMHFATHYTYTWPALTIVHHRVTPTNRIGRTHLWTHCPGSVCLSASLNRNTTAIVLNKPTTTTTTTHNACFRLSTMTPSSSSSRDAPSSILCLSVCLSFSLSLCLTTYYTASLLRGLVCPHKLPLRACPSASEQSVYVENNTAPAWPPDRTDWLTGSAALQPGTHPAKSQRRPTLRISHTQMPMDRYTEEECRFLDKYIQPTNVVFSHPNQPPFYCPTHQ